MRIASGQFSAGREPQRNLLHIGRLMEAAALGNADLLVLPESSLYASAEPAGVLAEVAEPLDGPFIGGIAALAKALRLPVVVGTAEANPNGLPYNTLVAIDARGAVEGTYRKSTSTTPSATAKATEPARAPSASRICSPMASFAWACSPATT